MTMRCQRQICCLVALIATAVVPVPSLAQTWDTPGAYVLTAPAGATLLIEAWGGGGGAGERGGGGGGGASYVENGDALLVLVAGGGGGGGAGAGGGGGYAEAAIEVSAGDTLHIVVGTGGESTCGPAGGDGGDGGDGGASPGAAGGDSESGGGGGGHPPGGNGGSSAHGGGGGGSRGPSAGGSSQIGGAGGSYLLVAVCGSSVEGGACNGGAGGGGGGVGDTLALGSAGAGGIGGEAANGGPGHGGDVGVCPGRGGNGRVVITTMCMATGPELCDGVDNDCDASTPDGSQDPLLGTSCDGADADLCDDDAYDLCDGGILLCDGEDAGDDGLELCDGVDNDCDASTPDGSQDPLMGTPCDGADADLCDDDAYDLCDGGILLCDGEDAGDDGLELCDGVDNDCDASTADGSQDPLLGTPCDGADADLCDDDVYDLCDGGILLCDGDDAGDDGPDLCGGEDDESDLNGSGDHPSGGSIVGSPAVLTRHDRGQRNVVVRAGSPTPVMELDLTSEALAATLVGLRLVVSGIDPALMGSTRLNVALFEDVDNDGSIDGGSQPLASTDVELVTGDAVLSGIGCPLSAASARHLLIVLSVETGDWRVAGAAIGLALLALWSLLALVGSPVRRWACTVVLLAALAPTACGRVGFYQTVDAVVSVETNADVQVLGAPGEVLFVHGAPLESAPFEIRL